MKITKLRLNNFKSFSSLDLSFDSFSVIVGANAAGKSNLISAFKFIKDIMLLGVDNAVALQGGIKNIINSQCSKGADVTICFQISFPNQISFLYGKNENIGLEIDGLNYSFSLVPHKRGNGYRIRYDELEISYRCYGINPSIGRKQIEEKYTDLNTIFKAKYIRRTQKSRITFSTEFGTNIKQTNFSDKDISYNDYGKFFSEYLNNNKDELMLNKLAFLLPPVFSEENFINIYDFDPKMLKHSCSMTSMKRLEENGANLAAVLQDLLKSKGNRKDLTILLSNALPFVTSISIESNVDQSYSFKIKEKFSSKSFHSNFLSDGTVSVIAIIIALYFEKLTNTIIIEEPERNIHPMLLQKVVEMAKDVSNSRQIIFTTHNPEIIKNVSLESIILIKRDNTGSSVAIRPSNSEAVKCFLENELGLEELFLQNLLGE